MSERGGGGENECDLGEGVMKEDVKGEVFEGGL